MNKKMVTLGISSLLFSTFILGNAVNAQAQSTNTESKSHISTKSSSTTISNWNEFKTAIMDQNVSDITLTTDIKMEETLFPAGKVKNIHGDEHTIDANHLEIGLATDGSKATMENVKIINTDIYGLFWSLYNVEVTYKNVDHTGQQLIYLPTGKLILDGTVTSKCTTEEVFQGQHLEVLPNADVTFDNGVSAFYPLNMYEMPNSTLTVGSGAKLKVTGSAPIVIAGSTGFVIDSQGEIDVTATKGIAIHGMDGSSYTFKEGSTLNAVANDPVEEGVEATNGTIHVHKDAIFNVESTGVQGTVITGKSLIFDEGSNFSIMNKNTQGVVFGSYATPTNVQIHSSRGINTWLPGGGTGQPDKSYKNSIDATFDLSGYTNTVSQTNMDSSDTDFSTNFQTGKTGKITGGSFVSVSVEKPIFDPVTSDDTKLTGKGIVGATINAYVGSTSLGTATVDNDGKWTISISAQSVGTKIDVDQTVGSDTSEKVSQTVMIGKPGFNVVNDKDQQLTGVGIPGATINAYVGNKLLGSTTVDSSSSKWVINLSEEQTAGTNIDVTQTVGSDTSEKVTQTVSHLSAETINFFKLGYWQPYGLILEGSIDNGDQDLSKSDNVHKTLHLKDSNDTDVLDVNLTNTNWYTSQSYNGYQAILTNESLNALPAGKYKISISLSVGDNFNVTQDLNVNNTKKSGYHTVFNEIEKRSVGQHTVSAVNLDNKGVGYLVIE